jgi:putative redox protein
MAAPGGGILTGGPPGDGHSPVGKVEQGVAETVASTVGLKWVAGRLMVGVDSGGRPVVISGWDEKEPPWRGLKASDLLLLAAAACASYDLVEILTKQREPLEGLEATCTGEQQPDPPNAFTGMHIHFTIKGQIAPHKVERAIDLSLNKYCSVVSTLRAGVRITTDYELG